MLKTSTVVVLLILCVLLCDDDSVWLMNVYESTSWRKSYQLISRNNNPLRNTGACNNVSQIFDYNQIPKSQWTETIQCYNCDIDDKDNHSGHNTGGICTSSVINVIFKTSTNYSVVKVCFAVESSDKKIETIATSVEYRPNIGTDVCYKWNGVLTNNHYKKQKHNYNYDYDTGTSNSINNNGTIDVTRVDSRWLVNNDGNCLISEDLRETNTIYIFNPK